MANATAFDRAPSDRSCCPLSLPTAGKTHASQASDMENNTLGRSTVTLPPSDPYAFHCLPHWRRQPSDQTSSCKQNRSTVTASVPGSKP